MWKLIDLTVQAEQLKIFEHGPNFLCCVKNAWNQIIFKYSIV